MRRAARALTAFTVILALAGTASWGLVALADVAIGIGWAKSHFGYGNGDGNSPHYLFYSGIGSIILPPALTVGGLALLWGWHNQCHLSGCFWPTRHVTAAGERACWLHYPKITGRGRRTIVSMREEHHLYLGSRPGKG